jgi:hypothetical protein
MKIEHLSTPEKESQLQSFGAGSDSSSACRDSRDA